MHIFRGDFLHSISEYAYMQHSLLWNYLFSGEWSRAIFLLPSNPSTFPFRKELLSKTSPEQCFNSKVFLLVLWKTDKDKDCLLSTCSHSWVIAYFSIVHIAYSFLRCTLNGWIILKGFHVSSWKIFLPKIIYFVIYRILHLIAVCVFLFCHCNKIPFQDRIVSMTLDKEYDVAVEAIRLVTLILQWVFFKTSIFPLKVT